MDDTARPNDSRARFETALMNPSAWIRKADDLLRAATALEPAIAQIWEDIRVGRDDNSKLIDEIHGPYFMLVAFALENLCKAAIVLLSKRTNRVQTRAN